MDVEKASQGDKKELEKVALALFQSKYFQVFTQSISSDIKNSKMFAIDGEVGVGGGHIE